MFYTSFGIFLLRLSLASACIVVPKMGKNGNNSVLGITNCYCSPFGIHALKTDPTSEN
jgi:hypothetical protein